MSKASKTFGTDCRNIMKATRDYVLSTRKFPSFRTIAEITEIPYNRCVKTVETLIGQKQLYPIVDGAKGVPTIIMPTEMIENVFYSESKPEWIKTEGYRFEEALESTRNLEMATEELKEYDMYEKLLFSTGIPLEQAVAYGLDKIGFQNVEHHTEDKDNADVTFEYDGKKYLIEIEGTTKLGNKDKILQLNGWMAKEIESGTVAETLNGFFVVNNERGSTPNDRGFPLTEKAVQYLKLYNYKYFRTVLLFDLIKKLKKGEISQKEARDVIILGESMEE